MLIWFKTRVLNTICLLFYRYYWYKGDQSYNRPCWDGEKRVASSQISKLLAYSPIIFQWLGALSYWWRWIHYFLLTVSATESNQKKIIYLAGANKIVFFVLIAISLIACLLYWVVDKIGTELVYFAMVYYSILAILLQIVINMFLQKLKSFCYAIYYNKK